MEEFLWYLITLSSQGKPYPWDGPIARPLHRSRILNRHLYSWGSRLLNGAKRFNSCLLLARPLLARAKSRLSSLSLLLVQFLAPFLLLGLLLFLLGLLPRRLRLTLLTDQGQPCEVGSGLVGLPLGVQLLIAFPGLLRLDGFTLAP